MYVVTGGAGFIGSNIVAALEERGDGEVVVCDWLGEDDRWRNLGKRELADLVPPEQMFDFLEAHRAHIKVIFHMGGVSASTETNADLALTSNFSLSLALWAWCARHGVRLIYASSAGTYGDGGQGFDDDASPEALARLRPLNPQAWAKHLFDRRVARKLAAGQPAPPQWVGLKFFSVYGPNEYHKGPQGSIATHIFPQAANGNPAHLFKSHRPDYADGEQARDFIWVGDCVDAVMWLTDNPQVNGLFNLGTGQARTYREMAEAIFRALGKEPYIKYVDMPLEIRDRYQYFTEAKMDRLRAAGYERPFTPLDEGVARYVQDYLCADDPYR